MRIDIKNDKNQPIGFCEDHNGVTIAIHLRKGFCGRYVRVSNLTFDKAGKIFCYGDGSQCLVRFVDKGYL